MIDDAVGLDAYPRALKAAMRPRANVVDLGAGTGIMSLLLANSEKVVCTRLSPMMSSHCP